jgi:glycosyltransferase involved in cell wall biosynthesis
MIGGAGIATYLKHAARAQKLKGHSLSIFTWYYANAKPEVINKEYLYLFDNVRFVEIRGEDVWAEFPNGPWQIALSHFLARDIISFAREVRPDVVETSDYQIPLYGYLIQRRAGLLPDLQDIPVLSLNHGAEHGIYRAAAEFMQQRTHREVGAQRSMLRWSDGLLVPSATAQGAMQRQLGPATPTYLIREPFVPSENPAPPNPARKRFTFLGRIGFAKGLDHAIHFLNVVSSFSEIEEIVLIGSVLRMPFRRNEASNYLLNRLDKKLHDKVSLRGAVPASEVDALLSGGGYSLNFSRTEAFGYAFIEQMSAGLIPFTKADAAMAEFYPEDLHNLLLPPTFDLDGLREQYERIVADGKTVHSRVFARTLELTNPAEFASRFETVCDQAMERLRETQRRSRHRRRRRYTAEDVSFLIATYNPGPQIERTIDSICEQTTPPREIVIVDDGSRDENSVALLERLSTHGAVRFVRSQANEGLSATRNKLVSACRSELAIFMDDDDTISNEYVDSTIRTFNDSPIVPDAVVTWRRNFGGNGDLNIEFNIDDQTHLFINDLRMTALIRTAVLKATRFASSMRNGEADDWDFWLRFKRAGFNAVCLPRALFHYHVRQGSMSWPWSEGQVVLTAELVAKRFWEVIQDRALPEDTIYDLISMPMQTNYMVDASEGHGAQLVRERVRREAYIKLARASHPVVGALLALAFRLTTSAAKRLAMARTVAGEDDRPA